MAACPPRDLWPTAASRPLTRARVSRRRQGWGPRGGYDVSRGRDENVKTRRNPKHRRRTDLTFGRRLRRSYTAEHVSITSRGGLVRTTSYRRRRRRRIGLRGFAVRTRPSVSVVTTTGRSRLLGEPRVVVSLPVAFARSAFERRRFAESTADVRTRAVGTRTWRVTGVSESRRKYKSRLGLTRSVLTLDAAPQASPRKTALVFFFTPVTLRARVGGFEVFSTLWSVPVHDRISWTSRDIRLTCPI